QLAERQAVARADGLMADEALNARLADWSLDVDSAQRVRTIENDGEQSDGRGGFQAQAHRRREGVVTAAYVRQVDDQRVQAGKVFRRRTQAGVSIAVQANDG